MAKSGKKTRSARRQVRDLGVKAAAAVKGGGHVIDKASPVLLKACATGEHIKEATITI